MFCWCGKIRILQQIQHPHTKNRNIQDVVKATQCSLTLEQQYFQILFQHQRIGGHYNNILKLFGNIQVLSENIHTFFLMEHPVFGKHSKNETEFV